MSWVKHSSSPHRYSMKLDFLKCSATPVGFRRAHARYDRRGFDSRAAALDVHTILLKAVGKCSNKSSSRATRHRRDKPYSRKEKARPSKLTRPPARQAQTCVQKPHHHPDIYRQSLFQSPLSRTSFDLTQRAPKSYCLAVVPAVLPIYQRPTEPLLVKSGPPLSCAVCR